MLDRQGGTIHFECDSCDATLDSETNDFDDARTHMKSEGWRAVKLGNKWLHFCQDCDE